MRFADAHRRAQVRGFTTPDRRAPPQPARRLAGARSHCAAAASHASHQQPGIGKERFITSLSIPAAEPSTPEPTYAIPASSKSPWMVHPLQRSVQHRKTTSSDCPPAPHGYPKPQLCRESAPPSPQPVRRQHEVVLASTCAPGVAADRPHAVFSQPWEYSLPVSSPLQAHLRQLFRLDPSSSPGRTRSAMTGLLMPIGTTSTSAGQSLSESKPPRAEKPHAPAPSAKQNSHRSFFAIVFSITAQDAKNSALNQCRTPQISSSQTPSRPAPRQIAVRLCSRSPGSLRQSRSSADALVAMISIARCVAVRCAAAHRRAHSRRHLGINPSSPARCSIGRPRPARRAPLPSPFSCPARRCRAWCTPRHSARRMFSRSAASISRHPSAPFLRQHLGRVAEDVASASGPAQKPGQRHACTLPEARFPAC